MDWVIGFFEGCSCHDANDMKQRRGSQGQTFLEFERGLMCGMADNDELPTKGKKQSPTEWNRKALPETTVTEGSNFPSDNLSALLSGNMSPLASPTLRSSVGNLSPLGKSSNSGNLSPLSRKHGGEMSPISRAQAPGGQLSPLPRSPLSSPRGQRTPRSEKHTDETYLALLIYNGQGGKAEAFLKKAKVKNSQFDINWQDQQKGGNTVLHAAADTGNEKLCKLLIEKGAQQKENHQGNTPRDVAIAKGFESIARLLENVSVAEQSPEGTPKRKGRRFSVEGYDETLKSHHESMANSLVNHSKMINSSREKESVNLLNADAQDEGEPEDSHLHGDEHDDHLISTEVDDKGNKVTIVDGHEYFDDLLKEVITLHHFYGQPGKYAHFGDLVVKKGKILLLVEEHHHDGWAICKDPKSGEVGWIPSEMISYDGEIPLKGRPPVKTANKNRGESMLAVLNAHLTRGNS